MFILAATVDWTQIILQFIATVGIVVVALIVNKNRATIKEHGVNNQIDSVNTDTHLKEIHDLVNDRLDTALNLIEDLRDELRSVKKERDRAVKAAG